VDYLAGKLVVAGWMLLPDKKIDAISVQNNRVESAIPSS